MKTPVTRFAPSPTGFIHVGNIRSALFAWLVAKQSDGKFILRIEDTDKQREVSGAEQHIIQSLKWLGISWDEGPDVGGPQTPYRQSERLIIYADWAQRLIAEGRAYADPYNAEEVQSFREESKKQKKPFLYRNYRPENPPKWDGTQPLRFKSEPKSYTWHDEVLGELSAGEEAVDDFVLIKSDGFPTYNFCHIVDDAIMGVTHVIRSQEFIASVPKFLNLYEALKVDKPVFATLPFVMALDGHKKLSKRDGAKDVLAYASEGYLPEAMVNFLASLGWNDGTEQEIFTVDELISKFSLSQVQKSPARFDEKRLLWMNGQWIRQISVEELYARVEPYWPKEASNSTTEYKMQVLELAHERLKTLSDLSDITSFLFTDPAPNIELFTSNKQLSKLGNDTICELLELTAQAFQDMESFDAESIQQTLNNLLETTNQKPMILFSSIRIATTWAPFSPDLAPSLALLGKEATIKRLNNAIALLA